MPHDKPKNQYDDQPKKKQDENENCCVCVCWEGGWGVWVENVLCTCGMNCFKKIKEMQKNPIVPPSHLFPPIIFVTQVSIANCKNE